MSAEVMDDLVRAGSLLSDNMDSKSIISVLVEQSLDVTKSDISCFYGFEDPDAPGGPLSLVYRRGRYDLPKNFPAENPLIEFLKECRESVVMLSRRDSFFEDIFVHGEMNSGIALPVFSHKVYLGILFLNSRFENFYERAKFEFLDSFTALAAGMLHNARLYTDLKEQLRYTEELERYQENIFTSMTNFLVTLDADNTIRYANSAAAVKMGIGKETLGKQFPEVLGKALSRKVYNAVDKARREDTEILGLEGILKTDGGEIDFSLNLSPLRGKRGKDEGVVLLFTDQTRERELKNRVSIAVEERRIIKDMFSRYLSQEVVHNLMEKPELVRPGGAKKTATVFFADIRGYTSFSEGKEPEHIIEVLNEYFSEAVEVIIKHQGYIDKFIGDCIMAAWGVPLVSEQQDALFAVRCAYEIQQMVASKDRKFFTGDASKLKIGIGMHSGPLVAGNLGSSRRMDYSIIGDTVNVAARLEGLAAAGEIIITQNTADFIADYFSLKKLKAVSVKGKSEPISVFKVLKQK
jgi:PAS domain S-box-containing protein